MIRTRIKICGLTRVEDVTAAVQAGADAVGFVCYSKSPRYVEPAKLAELAQLITPLVVPVLLFVNASESEVQAALIRMPNAILQFHGDESPQFCEAFARPYLRAVAVSNRSHLLDCEQRFPSATGLLADTPSQAHGGTGIRFDWSLLPLARERTKLLLLAGGLNADNVGAAITTVRPYAVDVSSGVEAITKQNGVVATVKGVKDAARINSFIAAVRAADAALSK